MDVRQPPSDGEAVGAGNAQGQESAAPQAQEQATPEMTKQAIVKLLKDLGENASTDEHAEWFFLAADFLEAL
jgi:hypothetical protein